MTDAELLEYLTARHTLSPTGCLEWPHSRRGVVRYGDGLQNVPRLMWFLRKGSWPTPMVLHSCDNPRCSAEDHLREGTALDNSHDLSVRERHPRMKLTQLQKAAIAVDPRPTRVLVAEYGVGRSLIKRIRRDGKTPNTSH